MTDWDIENGLNPRDGNPLQEGLRELNIPQNLVGNRDRWEWMHHPPHSHPSTPKAAKSPAD